MNDCFTCAFWVPVSGVYGTCLKSWSGCKDYDGWVQIGLLVVREEVAI